MRTLSLRRRIFTLAAATIVTTLAAAGIMLVIIFEQHVLKRVARDLDIRALELAKAFQLNSEGNPIINYDLADPRYQKPYSGAYWQINESGQPVLRSRSLWDEVLTTDSVPQNEKLAGAFEIEGPNKAELYVVERMVSLQNGTDMRAFRLIVALDHDDVKETRSIFSIEVAQILALLALLLIAGAYLQWRFGLLPLKTLRHKLNAVRDGTARRLQEPFPTEIAPLATDLNTLLDRQDHLVRKARDRAGALAHGLKTPLTILFREASRLEKNGNTESAAIFRDQLAAMRSHVERELARARTHGAIEAAGFRTEIAPIVQRLVDLMKRVESAEHITWDIDIPNGAVAEIETSDFAEIAGNLIDNARKWADTKVTITAQEQSGCYIFSVSDDGPGVSSDLLGAIIERGVHFGRDGDGSTGLGLAIVKDTLAEYGTHVSLKNRDPGLVISFPITGLRQSALPSAAVEQRRIAAE